MSNKFLLSIKARELLYINGAVLKFDRRVAVELMNDAVFLLENHVLQPDQITTPLRKLYFITQTVLMDPSCLPKARLLFTEHMQKLNQAFSNETILASLDDIAFLFQTQRFFEILKKIRSLYPIEEKILNPGRIEPPLTPKADAAKPSADCLEIGLS